MAQKQIVDAQIEGIDGSKVSGNIPGNAANVTGIVAISKGGTGESNAIDAISALLPSQTGNSGKFLTTDGADPSWATVSGGSSPLTTKGDLYAYSTADARLPVGTNGQVLSADSTEATGLKWITGGGGGSGTVTSVAASVPAFLSIAGSPITTSGTLAISYSGTALPVANGGTSLTTLTANNVILGNGTSAPSFVAPGTTGNVLTSNGTTWTSAAGGGGGGGGTSLAVVIALKALNIL